MLSTANVLLGCMLVVYLIVIYLVYCNYNNSNTVSCIVTKNRTIFGLMILMGILTLLYEYHRNCKYSFTIITGILIGIYGLLLYDTHTKVHYAFAGLTFVGILLFMTLHAKNKFLMTLLFLEFVFLILCLAKKALFCVETLFILNFAVFYLSLHYLTFRWNYFLNN